MSRPTAEIVNDCARCGGTSVLRSGAHCPDCTHVFSERRSPVSVVLSCSCGRFRHVETRRQNALARAAKMRAAERRHIASLTPPA